MAAPLRLLLLVLVLAYSSAFGPPALGGPARTPGHWRLPRPRLHREHARRAAAPAMFGARIVDYARRMLGVPYVWGGDSPAGFDCSGLVRFVYAHFGIALPHSSYADFDLGRRVARGDLRPGDLVFFDGVGHVGMYVGGGRFIHAPHSGTNVQITSLSDPWYRQSYDGARRMLPNVPVPRGLRNLFGG
jgi:cell wall-associated NlpC family hydrolase